MLPVDLNTSPGSAIKRVEILRDGASAQYGSDAIAGVINIVLRDDASGGAGSTQYGITENGDGQTWIANLTHGFALGNGGHLTLTAKFRDRGPANAAGIDPRVGRGTQHQGDPAQRHLHGVVDLSLPLGNGGVRSEEHTSELPSLMRTSYAVFCWKKKK